MTEFDNSLRRQSYSLPRLLTELYDSLREQSARLAEKYSREDVRRVIFMGCGDSGAAAMAMRYNFRTLTGIETEVVPVIDFSRHYPAGLLTSRTLVVIISVSGNGARIEEAVEKAVAAGAKTLAVTKDEQSGIGRQAEAVLKIDLPAFERGPGNRNYFGCMLALLLFAVEMGRCSHTLMPEQADQCCRELLEQGVALEQMLPAMDKQISEISRQWADLVNFDFVGAGDDYVNAWFGHAKVIEAVGAFATYNNSEEWFHMNNFYRNIKGCGTLLFATRNSGGISRTKEAVQYAARIGRPVLVVTDEAADYFGAEAYYLAVPAASWPPAALLTHYLPSCLLAGYIGAMKGERNCRGCLGPWEFAAGGASIKNSQKIIY